MPFYRPNHPLFQVANALLLLSYMQKSVLSLRIVLCAASVCYAVWGGVILDIAADTVVWNSVFAGINLVMALRILRDRIPPRMTPREIEIYEHDFQPYLTKKQFRMLLNKGMKAHARVKGSQLVRQGNLCNRIIYFGPIPDNSVALYRDGVLLVPVAAFTWVCVPEYLDAQRDAFGNETDAAATVDVVLTADADVPYFEFTHDSLEELFRDPHHGQAIQNALRSMWLLHYCSAVRRMDAVLAGFARSAIDADVAGTPAPAPVAAPVPHDRPAPLRAAAAVVDALVEAADTGLLREEQ